MSYEMLVQKYTGNFKFKYNIKTTPERQNLSFTEHKGVFSYLSEMCNIIVSDINNDFMKVND